jgi:hypothetical protein
VVGRRKAKRRRRWKLTGAVGKDAGVEENQIAKAEEHQQITVELKLHWIGVQEECGRRSTVVQRHGGGRVGSGGRSKRTKGESVCATRDRVC